MEPGLPLEGIPPGSKRQRCSEDAAAAAAKTTSGAPCAATIGDLRLALARAQGLDVSSITRPCGGGGLTTPFAAGDRAHRPSGSPLLDVHLHAVQTLWHAKPADATLAAADSSGYYYHYGHQGFDDHGWGCAYRCAQTVLSWSARDSGAAAAAPAVPTVLELQAQLVQLGQLPPSTLGQKAEIGMVEVAALLGDTCRLVHLADGANAASELTPLLLHHFESGVRLVVWPHYPPLHFTPLYIILLRGHWRVF